MRFVALLVLFAFRLESAETFEVASVKSSPPATGDTININLGKILNGEVTLSNARLVDCIKFAWSLASDQQVEGSDWIKDKYVRFDVIGKTAPGATREEALMMLRNLLNERFALKMHTEQKKIAHYVLDIAKTGSKLHEVEAPKVATISTYRTGLLEHPAMPMQTLVLLLSRQTGDMVLDRTGLKGFYQVRLEWTPENAVSETGPSLFTAVREQLGLQLELRKDPVDVYVVDSALKTPIAN